MAAQRHEWLDERRKRVRCKKHGLHYDPALSSGCALCRKETIQTEDRKGPTAIPFLLSLLGLAVVTWKLSAGLPESFAPEPAKPLVTTISDRADPEQFREQIEDVERFLFDVPYSDLEGAIFGTSAALRTFEAEMQTGSPEVIAEAPSLEAVVREIDDGDASYYDLLRLRDVWTDFRRGVFFPADWFHAPVRPEADRAVVLAYGQANEELIRLLEESRARAVDLEEPSASASTWQDWTNELSAQLAAVRERLPPGPTTSATADVLVGYQSFQESLRATEQLASGSGQPATAPRVSEILETARTAGSRFTDALARG